MGFRLPPNQLEPVESVVERVAARHGALVVFLGIGRHLSGSVVHFSHLLQPLPAKRKMMVKQERLDQAKLRKGISGLLHTV